MSGFLENLTENQKNALHQFRTNLADVLTAEHDDHYLLKWLRARQFDLDKAEKMLRDHRIFRSKHDCDNILYDWDPPEALIKYMIGGLFGHDIEGNPVWYDPYGCLDTKGIFYSSTKHDFIKYKIKACEKIQAAIKERSKLMGKRYERVTVVFDLEHAGFAHLWRPFMERYSHVLTMFEANYPEQLNKAIIINAPKMFSVGFQWIKPLISEETKKKVVILDSNYGEKLREVIGADQLPVHYGGTATVDGDPKCQAHICFGGKVPLSYYLNNVSACNTSTMETCQVSHGKHIDLIFQVVIPGSAFSWEFLTEHDNIAFGILLQKNEEEPPQEVLAVERYECHMVPESGGITCQTPGSYIVRFDNSYSWLKNKKVFYHIEVLPPDTEFTTS